jgi:hypothetical protein
MKEINKTDIVIDIEMANNNIYMLLLRTKQMYEDTKKKKEVIRSRKSKNDRQYYGQTFD